MKDNDNSLHRGGITGEKIKASVGRIDKEALAGAIGLMCLSWAALPVVYWLIVHKNNNAKKGKSREMETVRNKSKETKKS